MAQDYFTTGAQLSKRDQNRDKSRSEANWKMGEGPVFGPDKDYMKEVGKQGLQRQQEDMKVAGDDEAAKEAAASTKHKIPSYKKGGKIRKTGLVYMHKGEKVIPVKAQRKRG